MASPSKKPTYLPKVETQPVTVTCPICGRVIDIPQYDSITRTEALKRHIERAHGEAREATLLDPKRFPKRTEALKKLKGYEIVEVHDDGDLTVSSQGKLYVVTTEGQIFEQKYLPQTTKPEHHSMWMTPEQRKECEREAGAIACRWAEEFVAPGDFESARKVARVFYEKMREAVGIA